VKRKHRTALRYAAFAIAVCAACAVLARALLDDREPEVDGFIPGVTNVHLRGIPAHAPAVKFSSRELAFDHFPGRRTHRLPEDMGSGAALEDFDGDGDLDLFLVNNGPLDAPPPPCAMLRNDGGRFEPAPGAWPALFGNGVAAADYDGDGDPDLFVTGYGRSVLLRNDGGLRFTDVTADAGIEVPGFGAGAGWGDADGDGDLDLYVCRYVDFDESAAPGASRRGASSLPATLNPACFEAQSNLLFLQDDGRFVECAAKAGVANPGGKSLGACFVDFDADGKLDLYVANDVTDNVMYRGRGGGRFEDASHASCTADWRGAMGLAVADADNDGDLDLFITHWKPEENALYAQESGMIFRDASMRTYLGPPGRGLVGWACGFFDVDADGRPDLYVVNGSTFERPESPLELAPMPMQLFWSAGERFHDLAPRAGPAWAGHHVARGAACGDVDGDRDLDLVVVRHGKRPLLLVNGTEGADRILEVRVFGSERNVLGYGATVTVEAGGKTQSQVVGAQVGYLGSGPHVLSFGLGDAGRADRVVVRYPSGRVVERRNVLPRRPLDVREVDPRRLGPRMDAARDALARGDNGNAVRELRALVDLDPVHATGLYLLAQLVDTAEALALCDRLVRIEPMLPRGHLLRAKILSDPLAPEVMDLDAALASIARARKLNRDETGGALEEGRVLVLQGELRRAAEVFERIAANPRAAALAALCRFRLGQEERARALLVPKGVAAPAGITEEGDTGKRRVGARDEIARLLTGDEPARWTCAPAAGAPPAGGAVDPGAALRFALDPPLRVPRVPDHGTMRCEADVDGDGDLDVLVASAGHALLPLPWWVFLRDGEGYVPVRGGRPHPAYVARALAVRDGVILIASPDEDPCAVRWNG